MEPIDEVAITNLQSYKDKKFVDISKEDLELGKSGSLFSTKTEIPHFVSIGDRPYSSEWENCK